MLLRLKIPIYKKFNSTHHKIQHHSQEGAKNQYRILNNILVLKYFIHVNTEYPRMSSESLKSGTLQAVFDIVSEDSSLRQYHIFPEFEGTSKTNQNVLLNCMYTVC